MTDDRPRRSRGRARLPPPATALLELDDIHVFYGNIQALKGVSLTVDEGEIVTLIGSNGAGKSTTLRAISGTQQAAAGTDHAGRAGRSSDLPAHEIVRMGIAHSPEGRKVFSRMTVFENLQMGAFSRKGEKLDDDVARVFDLFPRLQGATRSEGRDHVRRRAADAGNGSRADGAPERSCCSTSRRWASRRS